MIGRLQTWMATQHSDQHRGDGWFPFNTECAGEGFPFESVCGTNAGRPEDSLGGWGATAISDLFEEQPQHHSCLHEHGAGRTQIRFL